MPQEKQGNNEPSFKVVVINEASRGSKKEVLAHEMTHTLFQFLNVDPLPKEIGEIKEFTDLKFNQLNAEQEKALTDKIFFLLLSEFYTDTLNEVVTRTLQGESLSKIESTLTAGGQLSYLLDAEGLREALALALKDFFPELVSSWEENHIQPMIAIRAAVFRREEELKEFNLLLIEKIRETCRDIQGEIKNRPFIDKILNQKAIQKAEILKYLWQGKFNQIKQIGDNTPAEKQLRETIAKELGLQTD